MAANGTDQEFESEPEPSKIKEVAPALSHREFALEDSPASAKMLDANPEEGPRAGDFLGRQGLAFFSRDLSGRLTSCRQSTQCPVSELADLAILRCALASSLS